MVYKITQFEKEVYAACKKIPRGRVSTYMTIAKVIGKPKGARAVGNALNRNPYAPSVPCHRVVRSDGTVGGFASGEKKKISILQKEKLIIANGRIVDFGKVFYAIK